MRRREKITIVRDLLRVDFLYAADSLRGDAFLVPVFSRRQVISRTEYSAEVRGTAETMIEGDRRDGPPAL